MKNKNMTRTFKVYLRCLPPTLAQFVRAHSVECMDDENGPLKFYASRWSRRTVAVFAPGEWRYFIEVPPQTVACETQATTGETPVPPPTQSP